MYRPRLARPRQGKSYKCVARIGEYFFLEELQSSGPAEEAIGQFVASRQLLGHPVAVSGWNESYETGEW